MVQVGLKRHKNKFYHLSEIFIRIFLLLLFVGMEMKQSVTFLITIEHFRAREMDPIYKKDSSRRIMVIQESND